MGEIFITAWLWKNIEILLSSAIVIALVIATWKNNDSFDDDQAISDQEKLKSFWLLLCWVVGGSIASTLAYSYFT